MCDARSDPLLTLWRQAAATWMALPAVAFRGTQLSYAELNRQSHQLAGHLRARGVLPGDRVGLGLERGLHVPVALLAVLRAGATYVPLDPRYPAERLALMLADSEPRLLLTQQSLRNPGSFPDSQTLLLDRLEPLPQLTDDPPPDATADVPAYVIYTSGSTGRPKGVVLGRAALGNLIAWQATDSRVGEGSRTLQYTPLSFDVHFQEYFATWATGGTLVLVDEETRLDPVRLLHTLADENIERLFLPFIALQSMTEAARSQGFYPGCLREVITAGEQLRITPAVEEFFTRLPGCTLANHYGPSETHVVTACTLRPTVTPPSAWPRLPPIGASLPGVALLLLDDQGQPVPPGEAGELVIGGIALAEGYLNRPDLTAERFVHHQGQRVYRSGDLARRLDDGQYEYLGRLDGQVKIRGHRVEPGEIEVALMAHPAVAQAAVTVHEPTSGDRRLIAHVVPRDRGEARPAELRDYLAARLPGYMVPAAILTAVELPRTPSGKVDRRALPAPELTRADLATEFVEPAPGLESALASLWRRLLGIDRVGSRDNFFELGGDSLLAARMIQQLHVESGIDLPIAALFRHPSVAELAAHLNKRPSEAPSLLEQARRQLDGSGQGGAIAVVGMAGRFPGAGSVEALWRNLIDGVESITLLRDDQLDPGIPAEERQTPGYVRAAALLDGADRFDAGFFGIPPREAELMDPQQRLFLETAWHALEQAGHIPDKESSRIGVFAGEHNNTYREWAVSRRPDLVHRLGAFQTMLVSEKDYLATRTAHALGLTGPALSLNTACSTSLVAVVQAVHALRTRQCDLALAGGVTVLWPQQRGYVAQEGAMLSPDGHCRPFDARAAGTVFGSGVGVVVLRRLDDAVREGNTIYAVIRGAAINNDGARKVGFAAPAVQGQAEVVAQALAMAGVGPEAISYLEAHGTATPLGDPVEVEALLQVFGNNTDRTRVCTLGSIKSNVGHLVSAAGVAGLIKTVLALQHERIPPTLHFEIGNPRIDWNSSPFRVSATAVPWPRGPQPRLAGVSSFGVGGTNAHVIVEEAPLAAPAPPEDERCHLLPLSARDAAALAQASTDLAAHLRANPQPLADVAWTLQVGRRDFAHRRFVVARNAAEAAEALARPVQTAPLHAAAPRIAFLFPGQGAQHPGMGRDLYARETVFRTWIDRAAEVLCQDGGADLRDLLFTADADRLEQTIHAQPALFAFGYALARQWQAWGIEPALAIGHSVGEFVAASLAGVFSFEDGLRLVHCRARLMQQQPAGVMLSVRRSADEVRRWLSDDCALASSNAPSLCVVSGPESSVAVVERRCADLGVACRRLHTSHAFHSPLMDAAVEPFLAEVRRVPLHPPQLPIISTVTGAILTSEQAIDPAYWAGQLRATVRFADSLRQAATDRTVLFLEVGPRTTLTVLARQQMSNPAIASQEEAERRGESAALLHALGRLWSAGVPVDAARLIAGQSRRRIALPVYPFQRQCYRVEPLPADPSPAPPTASSRQGTKMTATRSDRLRRAVRELFEEASGLDLSGADPQATFLELGLDSLLLTQAALAVQRRFGVSVSFRQLLEECPSPARLAERLERQLPADAFADPAPPTPPAPIQVESPVGLAPPAGAAGWQAIIEQQLQLMARQLDLLRGAAPIDPAVPLPPAPTTNGKHPPAASGSIGINGEAETPRPFGAQARITLRQEGLTEPQRRFLDDLTRRYTQRTARSKASTQQHRRALADPRVVSGFRPETKEIVYPIVVERARGARLWDLDGNEYLDLTCGFGSCFFGHRPDFIAEAVHAAVDQGYALGPQHPLTGPVVDGICRLTGHERAVLCNTGSEAVLGAVRLARTVSGRFGVALFQGAYHGINDEAIVRPGRDRRGRPAAAGIPPGAVEQVLVLDYDDPKSLGILRERAGDLAAVLVEPVQSRHPDLQPRAFLHDLRALTAETGVALILDEVITGFRLHPRGAQGYFGIDADLCTYGKVIGGGLPIGVIAGKARYLDALDGGFWDYGDASIPEAGVTYFAGTFVRHPLALAAASAVVHRLEEAGPALQEALNARTARLVGRLNALFTETTAPLHLESCGSLMKLHATREVPFGEMLYTLLRLRGLHIWDARPCFLTTAHSDADVEQIVLCFSEAVAEMQAAGFYPAAPSARSAARGGPPVPGARLGKAANGQPAWFVVDPARPGKFIQVGEVS